MRFCSVILLALCLSASAAPTAWSQNAEQPAVFEIYQLRNTDFEAASSVVEDMASDWSGARVKVDGTRLLVSATSAQHQKIKNVLQKIHASNSQSNVGRPTGPESKRVSDLIGEGRLDEARSVAKQLSQRTREADANSSELEKLVREDFSIRQQMQMAEIRFLKQRITSLEERVMQQEQAKDLLIQQRLESLRSERVSQSQIETHATEPGKAGAVAVAAGVASFRDQSAKGRGESPAKNYEVRPGDVLGLVISHILDSPDGSPPVNRDPSGQRPPALGFPIAVAEDGMISLPLVDRQKVAGLSLPEVEQQLKQAYCHDKKILKNGEDIIMVSMIRKVDERTSPPAVRSVPNAVTQASLRSYKAAPGDTLGVFIPGVLGEENNPPVYTDPSGVKPPAIGIPIPIRSDGSINLPLIKPVTVVGKSILDIEEAIRVAYTEGADPRAGGKRESGILQQKATIIVSLIDAPRTEVQMTGMDGRTGGVAAGLSAPRTQPRKSASDYLAEFQEIETRIAITKSNMTFAEDEEVDGEMLQQYQAKLAQLKLKIKQDQMRLKTLSAELQLEVNALESEVQAAKRSLALQEAETTGLLRQQEKGYISSNGIMEHKNRIEATSALINKLEQSMQLYSEVYSSSQ